MFTKIFNRAKQFIYRNARPLDFALWRYHFENGSKDDVLRALSAYQNPDGGFAYGIEPDCWNVNSNPIATWAAIGKLNKIGFCDKSHPIVAGILAYLDSGKDFSDGKWYNVVASNNDYPHAVWWSCKQGDGLPDDNPTVSLAGFALKYADKNSGLYNKASKIVKSSVESFIKEPVTEMHTLRCYMELYEYCASAQTDLVDIRKFKTALFEAIRQTVCGDTDKWTTEYVCKPSMFFDESRLLFEIIDRKLLEKEAEALSASQQPDGAFPVTWQWYNDYKEFEISKLWWESSIIIDNLLFLKALQAFCVS